MHSGALYFDSWAWSVPLFGKHIVVSWKVVSPPGDYARMQADILTSFFYVGPALLAVKAVAGDGAAFARR